MKTTQRLTRPITASVTALVAAVATVLLTAVPAAAVNDYVNENSDDNHSLELIATDHWHELVDEGLDGAWTPPSQWYEYRYTPACAINYVNPEGESIGDVMCSGATAGCYNSENHAIRLKIYRRTVYADGRPATDFAYAGTRCIGPDEDLPTTPVVTEGMVVDVARSLAPQATAHSEPAATSYVNVPNNYYAEAPAVTRTVNLFGHAIAVHFQPAEVVWSFGDGTEGNGAGIAGAAVGQAGAVEHAYRSGGSYDVSVIARYDVNFTLPDGRAVQTDLTAVPGPATTLQVGEIQATVTDIG